MKHSSVFIWFKYQSVLLPSLKVASLIRKISQILTKTQNTKINEPNSNKKVTKWVQFDNFQFVKSIALSFYFDIDFSYFDIRFSLFNTEFIFPRIRYFWQL